MARLRLPQPRRQRNLAAAARVGAALVRASDALLRAYGPAPSSYAPAPPFSGQADHSAMAHARTRIRLCRRHRRPPCCRRAASRRGRSSPSARVGRPLSWRLHLHLPLLPSTKCSMKWLQGSYWYDGLMWEFPMGIFFNDHVGYACSVYHPYSCWCLRCRMDMYFFSGSVLLTQHECMPNVFIHQRCFAGF
ncbi:uncharacterized protein LOC104581806 isoform X1 [Brachypodium distachyon]|uniref:uncharacterized protein LOC104581806 isoform X1 n=1 Tax=Brachypodium distachyon TaxID=15368 RepID=UPI000D0D650D|nr:uncharacterized protein LOC104581806 isoform X1 [Brachypodium distachyon]|eukprot:XP_024313405.1 uncharacterized protein LOC104581806 isoform X1 [Brachypodium distachyon]